MWISAFFHRMGCKARTRDMAKWGRRFYAIKEPDDKKAVRLLTAILMGKEQEGAFRRVKTKKPVERNSEIRVVKNYKHRSRKLNFTGKDEFYGSWEWRKLRYQVLQEHGAKCMLCGATPETGAKICVDHIKPRALYPQLEMDRDNLQVLCDECNMGKGRWDETDWR